MQCFRYTIPHKPGISWGIWFRFVCGSTTSNQVLNSFLSLVCKCVCWSHSCVCVGMALESCVVNDWPQRYWDHQKILVMVTFYVHSEFCFKVRVDNGQWTVMVQCWCWKLFGKLFYIWVWEQNFSCQFVSISFSFSLFLFPPCFCFIMYIF